MPSGIICFPGASLFYLHFTCFNFEKQHHETDTQSDIHILMAAWVVKIIKLEFKWSQSERMACYLGMFLESITKNMQ